MPDMKAVDVDMSWECIVADGTKWRSAMKQHLKTEEDVISATKTVTPAFVSSATIDAATSEQEISKIKNKQNTLCLGSLIDGGIYNFIKEFTEL